MPRTFAGPRSLLTLPATKCWPQVNLFDLSGRVGLVTGSSRGIGFALAKGLLQAGARVVIHGRDVEQATFSAIKFG